MNPFQTISTFLQQGEPEVTGHDASSLPARIVAQLKKLARGECSETEREDLCRLVAQNPAYVPVLVESIKNLRPPQNNT